MGKSMGRAQAWLILWSFFVLASLAYYFRQVGRIFGLGLSTWVKDNFSLAVTLIPTWHFLQGYSPLSFPTDVAAAGWRTIGALGGASIVLIAAQGFGQGVLWLLRIRLAERLDRLLYRTMFGLGAIAYFSLGLALFSGYTPSNVRTGVLFGLAATLLWMLRSASRSRAWGRPRIRLHRVRAPWLGLAVILLACAVALVGALAPETEFDALWYHLWLPKLWLAHGGPVDLVNEYISLYPLTWELVYGAGMVFGGPIAAKLLHFACLPLTALLVYRITRRFFPQAPAWAAVALFVTVPTVTWEATTAYNDLALAFPIGLSLYALLAYWQEPDRKWFLLSALSIGLALAIKHLALLAWVILVIGIAWARWGQTHSWRKTAAIVFLFAGLSLALPLPWYLRSYLASGNPVFPSLYHLFGAFPAERWSLVTQRGLEHFEAGFGFPRTPLNLLLLPWNVSMHPARFGGNLGFAFWLLLPGVSLIHFRQRGFWLVAGFSAAYALLWASPLSSFQLRFIVPLAAPLGVSGAVVLGRLEALARRVGLRRGMLGISLAALLVLNLPPFISLHEGDRSGNLGWLTHVIERLPVGVVLGYESEQAYLARMVSSYRAWQYINQNLQPQDLVLTFSEGDQFYSERPRLWSDATVADPLVWGAQPGDEDKVLQELHALGVTYILTDQRISSGQDHVLILSPQFTARWLETVYSDERFTLYRLRSPDKGVIQ